eukprot:m.8962 g.8962  ORF g.8962 m.8962 type:complete len:314 (-) comp6785_c0_seq2:228-1169(-)
MKVCVVGACGGIGQTLSLLVKQNPRVSELALYDVVPAAGVAADISHVDYRSRVTGYTGNDMPLALRNADVVVIPAGVPRKPGMTRDDLFKVNAGIIQGIASNIAASCPRAIVCVITNPVNSTVPIVAEELKRHACYDPRRVVGVTTLDLMRARTFVSERLNRRPEDVAVEVIGGHSGTTIVPVLSTVASLPEEEHHAMTTKIQDAGTVVVEAKAGKGSATLSMAAAGALFVDVVLRGLAGASDARTCAYVAQNGVAGLDFCALPCTFGRNGVETIHYGVTETLSVGEQQRFAAACEVLREQIKKGTQFAPSKL